MTHLKTMDNLFAHMIGMDRLLNQQFANQTYPPHDVIKIDDDNYVISVIVAGYETEDLNVTVYDGQLIVKGKLANKGDELTYVHQGIAKRQFKLQWTLHDYMEVDDVVLRHGLLHIKLKRNVPEEAKPKQIEIKTDKKKLLF